MKRQLFSFLILLLFVFSVSAQNNEALKIDEFEYLSCGHLMMRGAWAFHEQSKDSNSKIYVIYYEGNHQSSSVLNKQTQKYDVKYVNPRRGEAFSRANEIKIYLNTFPEFSAENIVLVEGGYREKFILEIWIVPKDAKLPKPSPTLEEKRYKIQKRQTAQIP